MNEFDINMQTLEHRISKPLNIDDLNDLEDFVFWGWYKDSAFKEKFSNGTKVKSNLTLYARWEPRFKFEFNEDELAFSIVEINEKGSVTLPEEYQGYPITKLYNSAINYSIYELVFSNNIKTIDLDDDLIPMYRIKSITLGKGLEKMNITLFSDIYSVRPYNLNEIGGILNFIPSLESITVSDDHPHFKSIDNVLFLKNDFSLICYPMAKKDKIYELPEGITHFYNVYCLYPPYNNMYLEELIIPKSFTSFSYDNLSMFTNLREITVYEENLFYASIDGVLFSQDLETLYFYPIGKTFNTYSIPNTVKTIKQDAFEICRHLKNVHIPISVQIIEENAFRMDISIYCEAINKPLGWHYQWHYHQVKFMFFGDGDLI